jgi:polyketide cyclase/dehydrase/lipid transport protein
MVRIEVSHTFPVSVAAAFAYITDMKNWPQYWPDFIRIENPSEARWSSPGDKTTIVIKLLNRERALNMELKEFLKDTRVMYVSHQPGLPDVRHERHFKAVPTGCEYHLVVEYKPRPGFMGLFDKFLVKRSVERAMRKTIQNLDTVFRQGRGQASA